MNSLFAYKESLNCIIEDEENLCYSEEWLKRMDPRMTYIKPIMESRYNKDSATKWTAYWRTYIDKMRESVKNI